MSHLSNSGKDALVERLTCDGAEHCIPYSEAQVPSVYSIDRCIAWVTTGGFKKIWLQFPQDCCRDASLVLLHMQEQLPGTELVIIFNSSAKKCCVNLKNVDFRPGEGMIQFGRSCEISRCPIPRLRVPAPSWLIDSDRVCQAILRQCTESQLTEGNKKVVILFDMRCAYAMGPVYEKLRVSLSGVVMSKLLMFSTLTQVDGHSTSAPSAKTSDAPKDIVRNDGTGCNSAAKNIKHYGKEEALSGSSACPESCDTFSASKCSEAKCDKCTCSSDYSLGTCRNCALEFFRDPKKLNDIPENLAKVTGNDNEYLNVRINDVIFKLQGSVQKTDISFIYIGRKGPTLTSFSLKLANYALYIVDPVTGETLPSNAQKIIMQRNYKIEQIRDAQKIGLLISNFNVSAQSEIVRRLAFFIKKSGKKMFLQYSAHPDLPKLMNIPGVDVFVHIACAESTVVEREVDPDLYKLMVTPWELEVALNPNREWGLSFETNFLELLSDTESQFDWDSDASINSADEYSVSVSLLSNKTQTLGIAPTGEVSSLILNSETGALVAAHGRQVAQRLEAGRHLGLLKGEMPWYGLDPKLEAPSAIGTVVEGRKGVAGGYSEEISSLALKCESK
ncbi:Diphthamide synthesis DPH1/DPH2 [Trinorchestia longiramus]|nr:Diphthamide synthesis DPH1/DPH2 [Trinorchestia longiramus]